MSIKVGDKVRWWGEPRGQNLPYEVVIEVGESHTFVASAGRVGPVYRVHLSELTLVESAPAKEPSPDFDVLAAHRALGFMYADLKAENARLREALQMAVDTIAHNGPDGVSMAAALGIRPSIRHKETP